LAFPFRLGGALAAVSFEHGFDRDHEYREDTHGRHESEHGFQHTADDTRAPSPGPGTSAPARSSVPVMSVVSGVARRRWATVSAGAALLVAAVAFAPGVVAGVRAGAGGGAPPPRQLLDRARDSGGVAFAALAQSRGTLGLPDLPRFGSVAALLGGTTRARVWWAAPASWRVDVVSATGEQGTYGSRDGIVTWDYERNTLVTVVGEPGARLPRADDLLAPEATRRLLAGVGPSDRVTALPATDVAGRSAYGLRVVPTDPRSTIARADLWVDQRTALPLRLRVVARSGEDALVSELSDVRLGAPAPTVLRPPGPPGAEVDVQVAPDLVAAIDQNPRFALPDTVAGLPVTRSLLQGTATYGRGLVRFSVLPLPERTARDVLANARSAGAAPVEVTGGEAVTVASSLLNAVIARDDDRHAYLIAGLVTPDVLAQAARELLADPPPRLS